MITADKRQELYTVAQSKQNGIEFEIPAILSRQTMRMFGHIATDFIFSISFYIQLVITNFNDNNLTRLFVAYKIQRLSDGGKIVTICQKLITRR